MEMNPLVDLHHRHIRYLRVSITDRCNLRCRYCMPASGVEWVPHDQIMSYEEHLRILGICIPRGVEKVRVTGGEPLLRKGLVEFISSIGAIDGIKDLSLTTNGLLLSSMAPALKHAGLKRVNVSLDTLEREKFSYITKVDAFERVVEGILSALDHGLTPLKINVVAIRGFNDDEIPAFAHMTLNIPVQIRFIELMPLGCVARYPDHERITAPEIMRAIEQIHGPLEPLDAGLGPALIYRIPGAKGSIGLIGSMSEHGFCEKCNRIRITAKGTLRPCLFSGNEIDLLGPMRKGIMDRELEELIEEGVRNKPTSHGSCKGQQAVQSVPGARMFDIGG
jgi:GTP 3',8-cyclase